MPLPVIGAMAVLSRVAENPKAKLRKRQRHGSEIESERGEREPGGEKGRSLQGG